MDAADNRPECVLPEGPLTWKILALMGDCRLPPGESTINTPSEIIDEHGHKLEGDHDPRGHGGCDHRDTPEWKAEHPKQKINRPAEPMKIDPQPQEQPMSEHVEQAAPVPVTTETIGVDAAVTQVKSLVPADTAPALLIGGAAALAVIGAAIKLGPGLLKARAEARERDHEARMKELEIKERESEKKEDDHGSCATERATLSAKVTAVEVKVDGMMKQLDAVGRKVEKAVSSVPQFDEDFDPETINKRLAKLEKAQKAAPKKR